MEAAAAQPAPAGGASPGEARGQDGNGGPPGAGAPVRPAQPRSRVVKPGERRSKKGKRKAAGVGGDPPPLLPGDYVRGPPAPKKGEGPAAWKPVTLSSTDKAAQVELDEALMAATSRKGYRMARSSHGACEGTWFFEATVSRMGASGHARIGWSTRRGELQAPVGYDAHSFAYRDLEGSKVHRGLREAYGEPFREGDVIGCFLHLGQGGRPLEKERSDILAWRSGEQPRLAPPAAPPAQPLPGSAVAFTRNGVLQGVAYRDIAEGTYYPALSLYTLPSQAEGASLALNFGPTFKHPPPSVGGCPGAQPVCRLAGDPPAPGGSARPAAPQPGVLPQMRAAGVGLPPPGLPLLYRAS